MIIRDILYKYKYIIWDWNGTLIDDTWLCVEIIRRLLKKYNLNDIDQNTYREIFDFPIVDYYKKLGFDTSVESMAELAGDFMEEYYKRVYECSLFEDCISIIKDLKECDINSYILSASNVHSLKKVIENYNISHLFDAVNGLEDHYAKSKVSVGKKWFDSENILSEECIMIGDTCHDNEVALELGVSSLIFARGHQSPQKIAKCLISKKTVRIKEDIFLTE